MHLLAYAQLVFAFDRGPNALRSEFRLMGQMVSDNSSMNLGNNTADLESVRTIRSPVLHVNKSPASDPSEHKKKYAIIFTGHGAAKCLAAIDSLSKTFEPLRKNANVSGLDYYAVLNEATIPHIAKYFPGIRIWKLEGPPPPSQEAVRYAATIQYFQWKQAISHVNVSEYDVVVRTRLDVEVQHPETLRNDILAWKTGIEGFCKCQRPDLTKRANLPLYDVLYIGSPREMLQAMTLYDAPPLKNTNLETLSKCFMYGDWRDYFECATIVRMPNTTFRAFRNQLGFQLCAQRKPFGAHFLMR